MPHNVLVYVLKNGTSQVIGQFRALRRQFSFVVLSGPHRFVFLYSEESSMGNKLYVGNLPYTVRDETLQQAFGEFGAITSAKS